MRTCEAPKQVVLLKKWSAFFHERAAFFHERAAFFHERAAEKCPRPWDVFLRPAHEDARSRTKLLRQCNQTVPSVQPNCFAGATKQLVGATKLLRRCNKTAPSVGSTGFRVGNVITDPTPNPSPTREGSGCRLVRRKGFRRHSPPFKGRGAAAALSAERDSVGTPLPSRGGVGGGVCNLYKSTTHTKSCDTFRCNQTAPPVQPNCSVCNFLIVSLGATKIILSVQPKNRPRACIYARARGNNKGNYIVYDPTRLGASMREPRPFSISCKLERSSLPTSIGSNAI